MEPALRRPQPPETTLGVRPPRPERWEVASQLSQEAEKRGREPTEPSAHDFIPKAGSIRQQALQTLKSYWRIMLCVLARLRQRALHGLCAYEQANTVSLKGSIQAWRGIVLENWSSYEIAAAAIAVVAVIIAVLQLIKRSGIRNSHNNSQNARINAKDDSNVSVNQTNNSGKNDD